MMKCCRCNKELELKKTTFLYLDNEMYHPVLRCPGCGQVFLPEELVKGKIATVEQQLEDK